MKKIHSRNGINFELGSGLKSLEKIGEDVKGVILKNGKRLEADIVILGTGVKPNTDIAPRSIEVDSQNGGIKTDVFMRTSDKDVYAAGDVASYPWFVTGDRIRVEHISEAM